MNKESLHEYLLKVAAEGYANKEKEKIWIKEADGSTTIHHEDGSWRMHDNFFGGEPYGGREVIFYDGKPVWIMVYYGEVAQTVTDIGGVYSFLQDMLAKPDPETPLRGPKEFESKGMKYLASWNGDILKFSGREKILNNNETVYTASFMGGLVDQREE